MQARPTYTSVQFLMEIRSAYCITTKAVLCIQHVSTFLVCEALSFLFFRFALSCVSYRHMTELKLVPYIFVFFAFVITLLNVLN